MDLSILGKAVFNEELRNGPLNLPSAIISKSPENSKLEWELEYIYFLSELSRERVQLIERLISIIE
jgi:hypothetical protein